MAKQTVEDQVFETCVRHVSMMMARLFEKYGLYPHILANVLADSLGAYVAMASETPGPTLEAIARRVAETDHAQIRLRHFGWKLGVVDPEGAVTESSHEAQQSHMGQGGGLGHPGPVSGSPRMSIEDQGPDDCA